MNWVKPRCYAVQHKNESVRAESRSGGAFTALSDWVLAKNGIIYGCVLDQYFQAAHMRADHAYERDRMRGSKYIQSKLGDTLRQVREDLVSGKWVLFSGTSCQVDGLRKYLGEEYENLISIDIVCHGVPSPKIWNRYLDWQEKRNHSKVCSVHFRNKKLYGWRDHVESVCFENGRTIHSRVFTSLFYGHHILRPSCYECPYKSVMHPGDITIADYWGIENAAPEFDDNKGVSLVLVNNDVGKKVFDAVKSMIRWKETRLEDSIQSPLKAPFPMPNNRTTFWCDFSNEKFDYVAKKYGGWGIMNIVKRILGRIKRKLIG